MTDAEIAKAFRPHLKLSKRTRCFGLTFSETSPTPDYCRKEFDDKFVVFAHVTRPGASNAVANPDGNTFRISYGGKILYGFYGRSGSEVDVFGIYWGDPQ